MQEEKEKKPIAIIGDKQTPKEELKKSLEEMREELVKPLPGMIPNIMGVQMLKAGFVKTEDLHITEAYSTLNFNTGMNQFHITLVDMGSGERRGIDFNLEPSDAQRLTEFLEQYPTPQLVRFTVSIGVVADPVPEEEKPHKEVTV